MYFNENIFVNSEYVSNNGLFLPSYITIKDEDILYICKLIKFFINDYNN